MENIELKKVLKYTVALIFILSLFLVAKILGEIKTYRYIGSDIYPQNVISVTGKGEVFAIPDTATFSFSVVSEGQTSEIVQKEVTEKTNSVIEALKKEGIDEKDIKTIGYNLYPKYEYPRQNEADFFYPANPVLVGYELNHTISVKIRKAEDSGKILGLVGQMNVSNLSSINFTTDDEEAVLREARKLAIEDAKEKASELSKDLGVRLVRIVNFSEGGQSPIYGRAEGKEFLASADDANSIPNIPVGENQIISYVYITYEIKN